MLLFFIFPANGKASTGGGFRGLVEGYQSLTGTWQKWFMFDSIFVLRSLKPVVLTDRGVTGGATLPDRLEDPAARYPRYLYTLYRMERGHNGAVKEAWIEALGRSYQEEGNDHFQIIYEKEYVRHLFHARKDGVTHKPAMETTGPYPIVRP